MFIIHLIFLLIGFAAGAIGGIFFATRNIPTNQEVDYYAELDEENDTSRVDFMEYAGLEVIFNEATNLYAVVTADNQTLGRGETIREALDNARYSQTRTFTTREA